MCTIEKLGIQGIRSFSYETQEKISFDRPVTLIVGHNGCGKTTIIECLKMASCGCLPPNVGSGSAFVHDPKWAKMQEVKGQIKMLFSRGDKQLLCARSFQSVAGSGAKKGQFKALDCTVQFQKGGSEEERRAVGSNSQRVGDTDFLIPQFMGVEKAILENVIFCHQEESNWPLMEQKTLKKKFDDIFGSTRYTRALQNITQVRQELTRKATELKGSVQLLGSHQAEANRLRERIAQLESQKGQLETTTLQQTTAEIRKFESEKKKRETVVEKFAQKKQEIERLHTLVTHAKGAVERAATDCQLHVDADGRDVQTMVADLEAESKELTGKKLPGLISEKAEVESAERAAGLRLETVGGSVKRLRVEIGEIAGAEDLLRDKNARREEFWREEIGNYLFAGTSNAGSTPAGTWTWGAVVESDLDAQYRDALKRSEYALRPQAKGGQQLPSLSELQRHDGDTLFALQQLALKHGTRIQALQKAHHGALEEKRKHAGDAARKYQDAAINGEKTKAREQELLQRKNNLLHELQQYSKTQREHEQTREELAKMQQHMSQGGAGLESQNRKLELELEIARMKKDKNEVRYERDQKEQQIFDLERQSKAFLEVEFLRGAVAEKARECEEKRVQVKTFVEAGGGVSQMDHLLVGGASGALVFGERQRQELVAILSSGGALGGASSSANFAGGAAMSHDTGGSLAASATSRAQMCLDHLKKLEAQLATQQAATRETLETKQREQNQLESDQSYHEKEVQTLQGEIALLETEVAPVRNSLDTLEEKLREAKRKYDEALEVKMVLRNGAQFYDGLEQRSLKKNCCELCARAFATPQEAEGLKAAIAKLRSKIDKHSGPDLENKVNTQANEMKVLESLRPKLGLLQEKTARLRQMQAQAQAAGAGGFAARAADGGRELGELGAKLKSLDAECKQLRSIASALEQLQRIEEELKELERNLRDKELSCGMGGDGGSGGYSEQNLARAREELARLRDKEAQLEKTIDQKEREQQHLNAEEQQRRSRLTELQHRFAMLTEKMTRREELNRQAEQTETELSQVRNSSQQLVTLAQQLQEQAGAAEQAARALENEQRTALGFVERLRNELESKTKDLQKDSSDIMRGPDGYSKNRWCRS
eukprot:g15372.t1